MLEKEKVTAHFSALRVPAGAGYRHPKGSGDSLSLSQKAQGCCT
ncbi:hypothetical protein CEV34_3302 [Brucella pseudogrignonensis]|uniref:Uncharacterized protein n=1 Tax=Brucella pseudogrignonensis TaxID=419475 RepID=A0A256GA39_9HYPH|nr:hypothetical protein CEV34_3302 [Brucella pseudogrignonensis]